MKTYDLIVIGSGPAGEKAALHAALNGFSVAVVERSHNLGGAGVNTGTLPSKTLRETALYLSGLGERGKYGLERELERQPTANDFLFRERYVVKAEADEYRLKLLERQVDVFQGVGSFISSHRIAVAGEKKQIIEGHKVLLATGSVPAHPEGIPFDKVSVHDSNTILQIRSIPKSICIVGAGVIGCEYASVFSALGSKVTLVNSHPDLLPFLDRDLSDSLRDELARMGIDLMLKSRFDSLTIDRSSGTAKVIAHCSDGSEIDAEIFLYATGRQGNVAQLCLDQIGLQADKRGHLEVDENYQTAVEDVFAAGDLIGFPSLGSTSMEQGRISVMRMFNLKDDERLPQWPPYGIYTIPEISTVGLSEEKAKEDGHKTITTRVDFSSCPRGLISGNDRGWLKLVCDAETHTILGVHIIGNSATELIHYGMELVQEQKTYEHILGTVFNFPTLHELYREAAYTLHFKGKSNLD